jgi:hypothetical protein
MEPEGLPEAGTNGNTINSNNNTATANSNQGSGAGTSAGHKRNGDELQSDSAVKRRASRACLSCRTRKVRCDVTNRGVPCTNCRLDTVECAITESWRGRVRKATTTTHVAEARSDHPDQHSHPHVQPQVHAHTNIYAQMNGSYPDSAVEDFPVTLTFEGKHITGLKHLLYIPLPMTDMCPRHPSQACGTFRIAMKTHLTAQTMTMLRHPSPAQPLRLLAHYRLQARRQLVGTKG